MTFSSKKIKIETINRPPFKAAVPIHFRKEFIAMAFFTDMKRSLTETGKQVAQKTKELSDTVQLKTQLSREKEALNRQYAQIGKKVFEAANEADEEAYTAEFTLIRESLKTIDELQDKLSTLEGFIHCPECGAKIEKTSAFCSKCGAKIAETKPEDDDIDVVDTAESSETAGEEKTDETCTCETVPDEKFETESAETTVNVTEDQE